MITQSLVFACIPIGLGRITEANVDEFFTRLKMVEAVYGCIVIRDGEEYPISYADVRRRIGLSVNVSDETKAKFLTNLGRTMRAKAEKSVERSSSGGSR